MRIDDRGVKWPATAAAMVLLVIACAIQGEAQPSHSDIDISPANIDAFLVLVNVSSGYVEAYLGSSILPLDQDRDGSLNQTELRSALCTDLAPSPKTWLDGASIALSELSLVLSDAEAAELEARGNAQSAQYLEAFVGPFAGLQANLTGHLEIHQKLLALLCDIAWKYFHNATDENMSIALNEASKALIALKGLRTAHNRVMANLESIRYLVFEGVNHTNPRYDDMLFSLSRLEQGYKDYEAALAFFHGVLKVKGPLLTIETDHLRYYLTQDMRVSGVFFNEAGSLAEIPVTLWLGNISMGTAVCESTGYFMLNAKVPADAQLGTKELRANITLNGTRLFSNVIELTVEKVPVLFYVEPLERDYSRSDAPSIAGTAMDFFGRPLPVLWLSIGLDSPSAQVQCDLDGKFRYRLDLSGAAFGGHAVRMSCLEDSLHQAGQLAIPFNVNVKTLLSLEPISKEATVGRGFTVAGSLEAEDGSPIDAIYVTIIAGNATYLALVEDGRFKTTISFDARGTYPVQAVYISGDAGLRNSTSTVEYVVVGIPAKQKGLGYLPVLVIAAVLVVAFLAGLAYTLARNKGKARAHKPGAPRSIPKKAPEQDIASDLIEEASVYSGPILRSEQEAVIRQYQSFLRYVVRRTGADISCLTPGEICDLSMKAGVPKKEARMITRTFEKAYYTGERVTVDDVRSMGRGTDKVLGGGK